MFPEEFGPEVHRLLEAKGHSRFGAQHLLDLRQQSTRSSWRSGSAVRPDVDTWLSTLDICITWTRLYHLRTAPAIPDRSAGIRAQPDVLPGRRSARGSQHELRNDLDMVAKWQKKGRLLLPVGFESIGFQQLYIYTMERMMLERGCSSLSSHARRNMSKDERILRLVPRLKNEFYIPKRL